MVYYPAVQLQSIIGETEKPCSLYMDFVKSYLAKRQFLVNIIFT